MRGTLCSHTTDLNSKLASSLTSFTLYKVSMFLQPVSIWSKTPQFNRISDIPSVLPIVFGQLDIFLKLEFLLHRGPLRLVLYLPLLYKNQGGFNGTKNQLMLSYSISNQMIRWRNFTKTRITVSVCLIIICCHYSITHSWILVANSCVLEIEFIHTTSLQNQIWDLQNISSLGCSKTVAWFKVFLHTFVCTMHTLNHHYCYVRGMNLRALSVTAMKYLLVELTSATLINAKKHTHFF